MLYYANQISKNISIRNPEGYLICLNVPIARSGTQQYLPEELGIEGNGYTDGLITVYRPEDEVFSQETIASFQGMPVTNDHPVEGYVDSENFKRFAVGHAENIRRGVNEQKDLLLADLVINDPETIENVQNGKREISCGYLYRLCEEDGKYIQREIRGNHVAIVDEGRAGHRVSIKDSAPKNERSNSQMEKEGKKVNIINRMLSRFARDAKDEELEEAVQAVQEINIQAAKQAEELEKAAETVKQAEKTTDEDPSVTATQEPTAAPTATDDPIAALAAKMDAILELLQKALSGKDCGNKDEEPAVDPLDQLEKELEVVAEKVEEVAEKAEKDPTEDPTSDAGEDPESVESHFVDPDKINEQDEEEKPADQRTADAVRAAIRAIRPMIAQLPQAQRKAAADAATAEIRKTYGMEKKAVKNGYQALANRKRTADANPSEDGGELGRKIMASRNANYKK